MLSKYLAVTATAMCCLMASAATAQDQTPAVTSAPAATPATPEVASAGVPKGTPIVIEIVDLVSTKTAKRDDMFNLKLAEPVMLNGLVAIPAGTPGKGQVIESGKPGMGGKPGKLVLAARYLEFEGAQIPIRGLNLDMAAKDNSGASVALGVGAGAIGGVIGLVITGGNMEVLPGTRAGAKLGANFVPTSAAGPSDAPQADVTAPPAEPSSDAATPPTPTPQVNP